MKITILDCVFSYIALPRFFVSTSSRSVHKSSSIPLLATVMRLYFLGVDALYVRLCSIRASTQGGVWKAFLNAFGIGQEYQQPQVFSLPSLMVCTLLFPLVCGQFLLSFVVHDLAFPQQFAGCFRANSSPFLLPAMLLWSRDTLKAIAMVRLHGFFANTQAFQ